MSSENSTSEASASSHDRPVLIDPRHRFDYLNLELPPQPQTFPVLQRNMPTQPEDGSKTYRGRGRLAGRRALITGGDSGIGRAVAISMAREGAKVAINYLPVEEPDASDLAKLLAKEGIKIVKLPGNLLDEKFCEELVKKAAKALGGLDILVCNAGFTGTFNDDISSYSTTQWDTTFRTNVYAPFFLVRAAVPLLPPGSSIIITVSDVVANPTPGVHDYAASKGALATLVQTLGISLGAKGIRINGVAPGLTYTPFLAAAGLTTEALEGFASALPLGRPGQPTELATVYVDLAEGVASYASGGIWQVNGGTTAYNFSGLGQVRL